MFKVQENRKLRIHGLVMLDKKKSEKPKLWIILLFLLFSKHILSLTFQTRNSHDRKYNGEWVSWITVTIINYHAYYNRGKRLGCDGPKSQWLVYGALSHVAGTSLFSEGWKDSSWEAEQVPAHSAVWEVRPVINLYFM